MEMANGRKARDVVDLKQQRVRNHPANAGDPHQALRLRRGKHAITQLMVEAPDLRLQPVVRCELQRGVQPGEIWSGGGGRHVVFLQRRADGALAWQPSTHAQQARAQ